MVGHVTHTHTHPFNGSLSGTTLVNRYQKGKTNRDFTEAKPIWILLKQETVSGSGISWAICKSAPRCRQITMPAPHHSVFTGRMPFLPPNQQCQSTEGNVSYNTVDLKSLSSMVSQHEYQLVVIVRLIFNWLAWYEYSTFSQLIGLWKLFWECFICMWLKQVATFLRSYFFVFVHSSATWMTTDYL